MRLVLDASVAIKFYIAEEDTSEDLAWVATEHDVVAPDIFLVEVMQALLRHHREGRLSADDLVEAAGELSNVVSVPIPSPELMPLALDLAHRLKHRLHDCMYVAVAQVLDCPILTADMRLIRKLEASRVPVATRLHTDTPS